MHKYPAYKYPGIEWLGEIPEHWDVKRVKTILTRNDGGVWGEDFDDDGVIVLRSTEQTVDGRWRIEEPARRRLTAHEIKSALLREGDLVVTKSSGSSLHIGKTSIVTKEVESLHCCYSNFMQRLRANRQVNSRFLWYVLNGKIGRKQFDYYSNTTTGLANLNGEIIGNVNASLPSKDEQRTIVSFLDRETERIDRLIEKKQRQIELLQEKRSALISHAVTKGLNPQAKMKDSGIEWLGEIPEHWTVASLRRFLRVKSGDMTSSSDFTDEGYRVFGGNGFRGYIDKWNTESNTIIIGRYGALCGNVRIIRENIWATEHAFRVIPLKKFHTEYFAYLILVLDLNKFSARAAQPGLNSDMVRDNGVCAPPTHEQKAISDFIDCETARIDKVIEKVKISIEKLREYRTALISAAVTGKIDVRNSQYKEIGFI